MRRGGTRSRRVPAAEQLRGCHFSRVPLSARTGRRAGWRRHRRPRSGFVGARLADAPRFDVQDLARPANRGQAVRDDERRAPGSSRSSATSIRASEWESRALVASSKIRMRGSRRIARADGDALALSARKPNSALADDRGVAFGEAGDEFVRVRFARRPDDLVVGRIQAPVPDVLGDRAVEELRLLRTIAIASRRSARRTPAMSTPSTVDAACCGS